MNIAAFTGNLTADPELKTSQNGDSVCAFTIAVKRPHSKDKVDFIDCVAWREKAEFISTYFRKGKKIEVSGYFTTRIYGNEGSKRKATELTCDFVGFGERKEEPSKDKENEDTPEGFKEVSVNDDLPF